VAIVTSLVVLGNLLPWQQRLRSDAFRQPPWHDRHPARLALEHDLPAEALQLARVIDRLVDHLSLAELVASYRGRGSTPHRPDLLLKAVLFFSQRGLHHPATWNYQARDSRVVSWLLRGIRPARTCWYAFRQRLVPVIDPLNQQLLQQVLQQGLLDAEVPVLDGTLLAANSSRHKLFNQAVLQRRLQQLQQARDADNGATAAAVAPSLPPAPLPEVCRPDAGSVPAPPAATVPVAAVCLASAEAAATVAPHAPPTPLPEACRPDAGSVPAPAAGAALVAVVSPAAATPGWMAGTPQGRQQQQQRYLKAQKELDRRLQLNAQRRKEDRKPPNQVRLSLGDVEATLGLDKEKVYRPLYNVQLVSDLKTDFCLAYAVFSGVPDGATLPSMLTRLSYFLGRPLRQLLADAGYATGANLRLLEGEDIELIAPWQENDWTEAKKKNKQIPKKDFVWDEGQRQYLCPEGHALKYVRTQTKHRGEVVEKHQMYQCVGGHCAHCPRRSACTTAAGGRIVMRNEYEEEMQRHQARMQTAEARQLYQKRKEQIERRVADSKEHRQLRKLSMRGQEGARLQVGLTVLANNMVVLAKLQSQGGSRAVAGGAKAMPGA
jgi:transposase